jgi:hypothetical protein
VAACWEGTILAIIGAAVSCASADAGAKASSAWLYWSIQSRERAWTLALMCCLGAGANDMEGRRMIGQAPARDDEDGLKAGGCWWIVSVAVDSV